MLMIWRKSISHSHSNSDFCIIVHERNSPLLIHSLSQLFFSSSLSLLHRHLWWAIYEYEHWTVSTFFKPKVCHCHLCFHDLPNACTIITISISVWRHRIESSHNLRATTILTNPSLLFPSCHCHDTMTHNTCSVYIRITLFENYCAPE